MVAYKELSEKDLEDGRANITAIGRTYREELTLQAPTTYWQKKQTGHRWAAAGWALAFVVLAACAALSVGLVWYWTVVRGFPGMPVPTGASLPYGEFIPTAGTVFLSIWVLRIVSRQLLAQFALSSDAGDRVAMVKTFLALMQSPEHVKEDDRILILSALFRPPSKSDDDGAPPNWFDLLITRLNTKS